MPEKPTLSPDEILIAEFEYITQTATQTNEDRARVTSFYLVSFGSFIAALLSIQFSLSAEQIEWVNTGFAGLFTALAVMGTLTVIQLARLRAAWFESVKALNQIKTYYSENLKSIQLEKAFLWTNKTLPSRIKTNTIAFVMMLEVAVMAGIAAGAAFFFARAAFGHLDGLAASIAIGFAFCIGQILLYRRLLK